MTLSRKEWAELMVTYPRHLLLTILVRTAEDLGIFQPHHPVYKYLVQILDFLKIL